MLSLDRARAAALVVTAAALAACTHSEASTAPPVPPVPLTSCTGGSVQLSTNQSARVDCSNGGNSLTLTGSGASYLLVPQLAVGSAADSPVPFTLSNPTASASAAIATYYGPAANVAPAGAPSASAADWGLRRQSLPGVRQLQFDRALRAAASARYRAGARLPAATRTRIAPAVPAASFTVAGDTVGAVQNFEVRATFSISNPKWKSITAKLAYAGTNLLLYVDTLAPPGGFTPTQLQSFGQYFDQTLYPIDVTAFGPPSDVDQNARVIMLMSPSVNALSPKAQCATQGYVEGYFDEIDLGDTTSPSSNKGEIFYSIVPDTGVYSCGHTVAELLQSEPATFLHELQHLINFSQHVVVHGGNAQEGWLDEGMSIMAEELGSMYYEAKCPPPSCRTSPAQLFPDSSQGFIQGFLYDSYEYFLHPDTASLTLHDDSENGFAWRGGDWLLVHWLYDQKGSGILKALEQTPTTGIASLEAATGEPFPVLFADVGLTGFTDSLPGQPRSAIPTRDRLTTRNLRLIYNRLFVTSGPTSDIPRAFPILVQSIGAGTAQTGAMVPGTSVYYRVDVPNGTSALRLLFSQPGGTALSAALQPQVAVYRLPPGQ